MVKLLINCAEQMQPRDRDDTLIKLFGRDSESELYEVTVYGFDPHFYALTEEVRDQENALLGQSCIRRVEYGDYEGMDGEDLARVVTPKPQDVRDAREFFSEHWSADVAFTNRFRVDTGLRAVADFPSVTTGDHHIECHWQEIEPVVPPSSRHEGGV